MKIRLFLLATIIISISILGCRKDEVLTAAQNEEILIETPDWTELSHGNNSAPDYSNVFKQDKVIRIDLKIDATSWATMQKDLQTNLGTTSRAPGGPAVESADFDPVWVPCSVFYNNIEWYKVGVRYKGNSSLRSAYSAGISKLSFKLDFDQFESTYPAIKDQRFYGFKQLNLKINYNDVAFIREKVGADLFREFGLASSQTTFCTVYVDNGSGPKYFGLYTLVEEVDDTVLDSQYEDGSGNLYKPDGTAASFASGSYNESQFVKQNNEELNNYSDVKALYTILHSNTRTTSTDEWKIALEKSLNVDVFLKWLAANTAIQNWDTYGNMTHNYYLYNNPADGLLNWIPWDNNEAFEQGKQLGALTLSLSTVGNNWPLIRYIIDVPEYKQKYQAYLKQFVDEVFTPAKMTLLYNSYYSLLKEYAYAEEYGYSFISSDSDFDRGIQTLISHVSTRNAAVSSYLQTNK